MASSGQSWLRHISFFNRLCRYIQPTERFEKATCQQEASCWPHSVHLETQPALLSSCSRLSLLEEWCGIRDEALSELSGIKDCIFVHSSGFIGGNKTQEGVLEMARRTLQAAAQSPANGDS